jgi:uncharacterized delta-60 repeat protein
MNRLTTICLLAVSALASAQQGANDTDFADGGWAVTGWQSPDGLATHRLGGMAVQSDGRIVLAGNVFVEYPGGQGGAIGCGVTKLHADGNPDTSFGDNGLAFLNFPSLAPPGSTSEINSCVPESVIVDSAGRIVFAAWNRVAWFDGEGDFHELPNQVGIARLLADGTLDTSFAFDGRMRFNFGAENREGIALNTVTLLELPGAKLFLAMTVMPDSGGSGYFENERVGTARVNSNGTLDTSYFTNGKRVLGNGLTLNPAWGARHAMVDSQGRVLMTGHLTSSNENAPLSMWVGRLLADGNLDSSFGASTPWWQSVGGADSPSVSDSAAVSLDPQNRILLAGRTIVGGGESHAYLARLSADGVLDTGFGTNGRVMLPFQYGLQQMQSRALAVVADDQSRIVVAGAAGREVFGGGQEVLFAVARLLPDGSLDSAFWPGGRRVVNSVFQPEGSRNDVHVRAALDRTANGRLLMAGHVLTRTDGTQPEFDFAVLALLGSVSPDLIFTDRFTSTP